MKAPTSRVHRPIDFDMTSMIDVVLQLIVFFLVSGHLAQQEVQLELNLPTADSGERSQETTDRRIIVNVLPTGEVQLSGKNVSQSEFAQRIASERKQAKGELEVRIRSDRHVAYRHVEPILLSCAKAGVWKVSFAVTKKTS